MLPVLLAARNLEPSSLSWRTLVTFLQLSLLLEPNHSRFRCETLLTCLNRTCRTISVLRFRSRPSRTSSRLEQNQFESVFSNFPTPKIIIQDNADSLSFSDFGFVPTKKPLQVSSCCLKFRTSLPRLSPTSFSFALLHLEKISVVFFM